jgi:hypothetical protein
MRETIELHATSRQISGWMKWRKNLVSAIDMLSWQNVRAWLAATVGARSAIQPRA